MKTKPTGRRTGAQALVECLERAGAEIVFGYPGGNVVDVFDHLPDAHFRFVLGRHEQGCVHMADGYARATGRAGVAIVTSGPGITNAVTALATANLDGVPLVLVAGQVPLGQIGTDAFQEADANGICRAVTKHGFLVKSADEIPETVAEAFYIATHGKPGAVIIDVPHDVQREQTAARYPERISLRAYHPERAAAPRDVAALARRLNAARRPVILAGGGVIAAGAADDLVRLAHKADMPVATTLMGIGSIDENDPHALGMSGMYGTRAANLALERADLILALGVRFNDRVTASLPRRTRQTLVHVDCDPSAIDKNVPAVLGIVADVKDLLTVVDARVKPAEHAAWRTTLAPLQALKPLPYRPTVPGALMPQAVVDAVAHATEGRCILVTDVGQHQMFAARRFPHSEPRHFITSGGMGTMGFGIPAAIGAALARPDERIVAILGDGGAQMTAEELCVAAEARLAITFVVVNNRSLGMVRQMQDEQFGGHRVHVSLCAANGAYRPDFVLLARAYGLAGVRVADSAALEKTIARAVRSRRPTLVEVMTDGEANV